MKTTLIDCATGAEITRYTLKSFWDGFEKRERKCLFVYVCECIVKKCFNVKQEYWFTYT